MGAHTPVRVALYVGGMSVRLVCVYGNKYVCMYMCIYVCKHVCM